MSHKKPVRGGGVLILFYSILISAPAPLPWQAEMESRRDLAECQCHSRKSPGFDLSILWGIWGAAVEAVFNNVQQKIRDLYCDKSIEGLLNAQLRATVLSILTPRPAARDGIFKPLWSSGIDFVSLCSLSGRNDNLIPTRFLAPTYCSKIPAPVCIAYSSRNCCNQYK